MRDLNEFTISGPVGYVDTSKDGQARVSVYIHDDYQADDKTWVDRTYNISVTYFNENMARYIADKISVGDWVVAKGKITIGSKDKGYPVYFNGVSLLKPNVRSSDKTQEKEPVKQQKKPVRSKSDAANLDDLDDLFG